MKKASKIGIGCIGILAIAILITISILIRPYPIYEGTHPSTNDNTVSIILIDGLAQAPFQSLLGRNKLPHLQRLIAKSTYVKNGISAFPSMTGYGYYPFITGEEATKSGIIGLRWYDRSLDKGGLRNYVGRTNVWMNQDVTDSIKNIFELSAPQYTASINTFMNRGVADHNITGWAHTTAKFEGKSIFGPIRKVPFIGDELAKNHFQHESDVMQIARTQLERNPKVQWITLPSPDASVHIDGKTDLYDALLVHIDSLVGDYLMTIDRLGQSDTRMVAIVTDHGISEVSTNIDILEAIYQKTGLQLTRGKSVHYRSMMLDQPIEEYMDMDGYFVINGNLSALIYLKNQLLEGKEAWRSNINIEALAASEDGKNIPAIISKIEGIEFVAHKSGANQITIYDEKGYATISKLDTSYQYATKTSDVLGYGLSDTLMSASAWLDYSIDSQYPDAIYRLYTLFESPQMGDILLTAKAGYDFAPDYEVIVGNYKGGHGGIRADQLRVPYILYIPGESAQSLEFRRAEDVGKMIKAWLGYE